MSQPYQKDKKSGHTGAGGSSSSGVEPEFVFPERAEPKKKLVTERPDLLPWWLQIDPAWAQELERFNVANNTDIVYHLQTFGMRWASDDNNYALSGLLWADFDAYVEDQPKNEEGFAQEHWVRIRWEQPPPRPAKCTVRLTSNIMHLTVLWRDCGTSEWLPRHERGQDDAFHERQ